MGVFGVWGRGTAYRGAFAPVRAAVRRCGVVGFGRLACSKVPVGQMAWCQQCWAHIRIKSLPINGHTARCWVRLVLGYGLTQTALYGAVCAIIQLKRANAACGLCFGCKRGALGVWGGTGNPVAVKPMTAQIVPFAPKATKKSANDEPLALVASMYSLTKQVWLAGWRLRTDGESNWHTPWQRYQPPQKREPLITWLRQYELVQQLAPCPLHLQRTAMLCLKHAYIAGLAAGAKHSGTKYTNEQVQQAWANLDLGNGRALTRLQVVGVLPNTTSEPPQGVA